MTGRPAINDFARGQRPFRQAGGEREHGVRHRSIIARRGQVRSRDAGRLDHLANNSDGGRPGARSSCRCATVVGTDRTDMGHLRDPRVRSRIAPGASRRDGDGRARLWHGVRIRLAPAARRSTLCRGPHAHATRDRGSQQVATGLASARSAPLANKSRCARGRSTSSSASTAPRSGRSLCLDPRGRAIAAAGGRARLPRQRLAPDARVHPTMTMSRHRIDCCASTSGCIASTGPATRLWSSISGTAIGSGCCARTTSSSRSSSSCVRPPACRSRTAS